MALSDNSQKFVFVSTTEFGGNRTLTPYYTVAVPNAMLTASSVLTFSQFPSKTKQSSAFGMPSFINKGKSIGSVTNVQFEAIIVRVPDPNNVGFVVAQLNSVLDGMSVSFVDVVNYYTKIASLSTASVIVNAFFIFTQAMAMSICFFSLMSSMATNIYEQTKEIGILRCIGIKKNPCTRVYVWEAFVLVVSASMMGVIVGFATAYTMLLQNALFTQLPLPFVFPWVQMVEVVVSSVFFAFAASFGPIRKLLESPSITHILRRTV